jgi:hypothetical protein
MAGISGVGNSGADWQQRLVQIARRRQERQSGTTTSKPDADNKTGATESNGNADAIVAAQTEASDRAARQAFFRFLRQHGIDPEEFRQALLAGIKDAPADQTNSNTPSRGLPSGLSIDTTA